MTRATVRTASSKAGPVRVDAAWTPLTLRTYWRAAASISSVVASGSSPLRVVMFRHTPTSLRALVNGLTERRAVGVLAHEPGVHHVGGVGGERRDSTVGTDRGPIHIGIAHIGAVPVAHRLDVGRS